MSVPENTVEATSADTTVSENFIENENIVEDIARENEKIDVASLVKRTAEVPKVKGVQAVSSEEDLRIDLNFEDVPADVRDRVKAEFEKKAKLFDNKAQEKFKAIGEQRRELEALQKELELKTNESWSVDRVRSLLKDPAFVDAAKQEIESRSANQPPQEWEGTTDEWSSLSDSEKRAFRTLESKVDNLLASQAQVQNTQEHERIKSRFPDYEPQKIEEFGTRFQNGEIPSEQLKELIWKGLNFDNYVENSYRFGLQDRNGTLQEKINGSSMPSDTSSVDESAPIERKEGESTKNFFVRIAQQKQRQMAQNKQ